LYYQLSLTMNKLLWKYGLAFIALMYVVQAQTLMAQATFNSPQECISFAKQHNRDLQQVHLNAELVKTNVRGAKAPLLPLVKGAGTFEDNYALPTQLLPASFLGGKPGEYRKIQFGTRYNTNLVLDASIPLINTTYWNNLKSSEAQKSLADANVRSKEMDISERISKAYYLTLLAQQAVNIASRNTETLDTLLQNATLKLKNGTIEPLEINRTKSNYLSALSSADENKQVLLKNTDNLKNLLGLKAEEQIVVKGNLDDYGKEPLLSPSFKQELYPAYLSKLASLQVASINLHTEQYKRMPEMSAYARYSRQHLSNDATSFNDDLWFNSGYFGLRLDVPILAGFAKEAAIQKATINQKIAALDLEDYQQRTKIEDQELISNYEKSYRSWQNATEALSLNRQNYTIALYKYTNGVYSYDQLINIYNEMLSGQNQYLSRLADYLGYKSSIETRNNVK
jgi:outer membrane protein TolC